MFHKSDLLWQNYVITAQWPLHSSLLSAFLNFFLFCFVYSFPEEELATPPLDGIILPGVTRQSILELTGKWVSQMKPPRSACMDKYSK